MAGIYIHIPFCKSRCAYCDFFSTTQLEKRTRYIDAVLQEYHQRKNELTQPIRTVYLGGGTPSVLDSKDVARLLQEIELADVEEITMELNPGDATLPYLQAIRTAGVNRLSIGIQSFDNGLLQLIGRRHDAQQAIQTVQWAQEAGFDNISIDLMYALPTQTMSQWNADIDQALALHVQHISCYGLMLEQGTALTRMVENGFLTPIDEDTENAMYDHLCERLKQSGFEHYEVSNFALPGYASRHNSSYWNDTPYIGLGAGAHSYNGNERSWNPSDLIRYITGITQGELIREHELLSDTDRYNERIMLGLRTNTGVPLHSIQGNIAPYIEAGLLKQTPTAHVVATQKGLHILNRIIEDLMI